MKSSKILFISIIVSLIFGAVAGVVTSRLLHLPEKSYEERVRDFYFTETDVHVSPHHIRKNMSKGKDDFILVDLRSQEEYEKEHIVGAVNIPAYKDPNTSAYGDIERIVKAFEELSQDKDIIVYCYSTPCMTGRKVGRILVEHDIYVKHLAIGWNEWRYFWNLWNHEHEWEQTDVKEYIATGSEPGKPKISDAPSACSIEGELGC